MTELTTRSGNRQPAARVRSKRKERMNLPPGFPLFAQGSDLVPKRLRWAKKVRGKLHYFGKVDDDPKGEAALRLWLDQKDDLLAGRKPRAKDETGLTTAELCNRFLTAKLHLRDAGEITARTWNDYKATTDRIVASFGRTRLVADLAADDFESLRASIAKTWGPVALGNEIQRVRVVFKYGYDAGLITQPVRYGPQFKRPSKKVLRLARAAKGEKLLGAVDLRKLIDAADTHLRAMIYLGLNCGFGNRDCGTLPSSAIALDGGWVTFPRPKTGVPRRCPLWKETVTALRESLVKRPAAVDGTDQLVFITRCGASWAKNSTDNPITKEFRKLLDENGLHRDGLGFYSLRHMFRTIADEVKDQPAANAIMGHDDGSMAGVYRERIADERLRAVTDHIHDWLFVTKKGTRPKGKSAGRKAR